MTAAAPSVRAKDSMFGRSGQGNGCTLRPRIAVVGVVFLVILIRYAYL